MQSLFVTGGAGFIGSAFVRRALAEPDARLVCLDNLTYAGNLASLEGVLDDPRHTFVRGDIRDRALVSRLLREHAPQAIVNFAAESHVDRSIEAPARFLDTNTAGALELLLASLEYWQSLAPPGREQFRFVQISTDEVYGSLGEEGRFVEESPFAPNSPYAASKAAADHFVRAFHRTYSLPAIITHCSNNYGPRQHPEKLIPLMTLCALERRPLPVYGDGQNVRDWLHVDDHCQALWRVLQAGRPGESYNIGGDEERTNLDLVQALCRIVDRLAPAEGQPPRESLITFVTDRPGHDRRYAIDAAKIERELGWRPTISLEQGLERTVAWYLDNLDWVRRVSHGAAHLQRLGLGAKSAAHDAPAPAASDDTPVEFRDGPIDGLVLRPLAFHHDRRGWLAEVFRQDEIPFELRPAMAYVSESLPGVVRGPHEHREQADYFAFLGPGDFEVYLWDARFGSPTRGHRQKLVAGQSRPLVVVIPPGVVHAYRNLSAEPAWVFNAPNRLYGGPGRQGPVDEIRHEERSDSPFTLF